MIRSLIWKKSRRLQIVGAAFAALTGLILLLGVLQFYFDLKDVMRRNRDLLDPEYLVINKTVSLLQTLNISSATFSTEEIEMIRQQEFAEKVVGFISNEFALSAYTESERFQDFYTDLFFEAIPDEYIDVKDPDWAWKKGDQTIPIILPQDYLNLYNFGFAPGQGLPQLSPRTISMVNFTVMITGKGQTDSFRGKIIGFSNRINSILVPCNFMRWANERYGDREKQQISRILMVTRDPTNPAITSFLEKNGYETLKEKLKSSRLNIILKFIISFLGSLGFFIIFLAFMVFILSFQLLIARSAEKIQRLYKIGYHYMEISRPFIFSLGWIMLFLILFTAALLVYINETLNQYMQNWGMDMSSRIHPMVIFTGAIIILLIFLINAFAIIRQTKTISKS